MDMRKLARGEGNKTIVCCAVSGLELCRLVGHRDSVYCVHYNQTNPRQLVSGSADTMVRLWDVDHGKELKKLEGHSGAVLCVEWAPDGSKLVSGGGYGDWTVKLWSPSTGDSPAGAATKM